MGSAVGSFTHVATRADRRAALISLLLVVAVSAAARLPLWNFYEPVRFADTRGYVRLAENLRLGKFGLIDGARTPGYPLLLLLVGPDDRTIWALQALLGIATAALVFGLTLRQTRSPTAAGIAGVFVGTSLNLVFFEAAILTEALTAFLLVLTVYVYARVREAPGAGAPAYLLLGAVSAAAALTRPLLLISIPLIAVFLLVRWRGRSLGRRVRDAAAFSTTALVVVLAWCTVVWAATGAFTPTTLLGYNLTQHSGGFMELAPDEYTILRDAYLEARAVQIAKTGSHSMTIWLMRPGLEELTGLDTAPLSDRLMRLSLALFVAHPHLYLASVARAWFGFWGNANYWNWDLIDKAHGFAFLRSLWFLQSGLLLQMKLALPLLLVWYLWGALGEARATVEVPLFLLACVYLASVAQALIEFGENSRYAVPFQPLIVAVMAMATCRILARRDIGLARAA